MYETAGKTSTEAGGPSLSSDALRRQWSKLAVLLKECAEKQDWDQLRKVDMAMRQRLQQAEKTDDPREIQARRALAEAHREALHQVVSAQEDLEQRMKKLRQDKEGLSAYELTKLSGD
ncbi:hypothetical protein [Ferrimonas balearica]|uniref:hypothetical protein n=1 Tax=Ferrimonas balearica TaxID=44012 RepID=UPI001C99EF26|nr:hypothetical protein [Ferrimonas balearica]MBY5991967.1 hypothetical protein [Ferrimonas balearica]